MSDDPSRQPRRRWLRREAISLGDLVVQVFAVVLGILLALFINNWLTQRQQQNAVDEAMRAMRAEVSRNRVQVRAQTRHLFGMAQAMLNAPANRNQSAKFCPDWHGWTGFGAANLTEAAYQTAIATQALAHMPFKQAQLVAQVYGWQHLFQKYDDLEVDQLIQHPQSLEFCVDAIKDIGHNIQQLDEAYSYLIGHDHAPAPKPQPSIPVTSSTMPRRGATNGRDRQDTSNR